MADKGLRFNEGKIRLDLLPPFAIQEVAKVFTMGANKYAERNWERGMAWSKVLASLERHILAYKQGEDYDPESGQLHAAHITANALFLTEYYRIYPEGDNRQHTFTQPRRIGLDIDDVLADFCGAYSERFGVPYPEAWQFDRKFLNRVEKVCKDKDFWLNLKPNIYAKDIPFEPVCYITSRWIPTEWTEEWLDKNGFPASPVFTLSNGESKVETAKKAGIDTFVDDRWDNFVELNANGILTYLMDSPHNRRYNVGYKRIKSLRDIPLTKSK